jgi:hypothetical protein
MPTTNATEPFAGPGAKALSNEDTGTLWPLFADQPLTDGQVAPRRYRWVNPNGEARSAG